MRDFAGWIPICVVTFGVAGIAAADEYPLLIGVCPNTAPGTGRAVFSSGGFPAPGTFCDGQRLGGTPGAVPTSYQGSGTPLYAPNEFGSLSLLFRRGSIPAGAPGNQIPLMSIDYLGGPLLDLDGDPGNGSRSLIPVAGRTPVGLPGSRSYIDLSFDLGAGMVTLNSLDATGTNAGASVSQAPQVISVNTLAGTTPAGALGAAINPSIDTRVGTLTPVAPGITRIDNLGFELWQDSIDPASSSPNVLGTMQFLGTLGGWLVERDGNGQFPALSGLVGTTPWPAIDATHVGQTFNTANGLAGGSATIANGVAGDLYGPGGLPLSDYTDLGAYLDAAVVPAVDPLSQSLVYLDAVGVGMNNSNDPIFRDSVGYDVVLVAQSAPIPEPSTLLLLLAGGCGLWRRHRARDAG